MTSVIFYSTTDGHTKTIAEHIAKDWQGPVEVVPSTQLENYAGRDDIKRVVIGASIRYGHFDKTLIKSISKNTQWLSNVQSAFYSVNLTARKPGKNDPAQSPYIQKLLKNTNWLPDHIAMFAGKLSYPKYQFWDKQMIRFIMALTGGCSDGKSTVEYTNWDEVFRFSKTISGLSA